MEQKGRKTTFCFLINQKRVHSENVMSGQHFPRLALFVIILPLCTPKPVTGLIYVANEKPLPFILTDSLGFCSLALSAHQSWQRIRTGGKAGARRGRVSGPCHCEPRQAHRDSAGKGAKGWCSTQKCARVEGMLFQLIHQTE